MFLAAATGHAAAHMSWTGREQLGADQTYDPVDWPDVIYGLGADM
jgi:hypothetical protein